MTRKKGLNARFMTVGGQGIVLGLALTIGISVGSCLHYLKEHKPAPDALPKVLAPSK